MTSSSFLTGMLRTLYFLRSSLLSGALMIFLLMWDGAVKCLCLFLRLDDVTNLLNFILKFFEVFFFLKKISLGGKPLEQKSIQIDSFRIEICLIKEIVSVSSGLNNSFYLDFCWWCRFASCKCIKMQRKQQKSENS